MTHNAKLRIHKRLLDRGHEFLAAWWMIRTIL